MTQPTNAIPHECRCEVCGESPGEINRQLAAACRNAVVSLLITALPRKDDRVATDRQIVDTVVTSLRSALKAAGEL